MDTFVLLVVAVVCVAAGIVIGVMTAGHRRTTVPTSWSARPAKYGGAPDSGSVRVGDEVTLEGTAGKVTATIGFLGSDAETWTAACVALMNGGEEWVTLVDEERGLEVCRWKKLSFLPGTAGDRKIQYASYTFTKRETGTAEYDAHGEVDLPTAGEVKFVDYIDGDQRLSFENYDGGGWEASLGRMIAPGAFRPRR